MGSQIPKSRSLQGLCGQESKKREFGLTDKLTGIFIVTQLAALLRDFILFQTRGLNCCNSFFFKV